MFVKICTTSGSLYEVSTSTSIAKHSGVTFPLMCKWIKPGDSKSERCPQCVLPADGWQTPNNVKKYTRRINEVICSFETGIRPLHTCNTCLSSERFQTVSLEWLFWKRRSKAWKDLDGIDFWWKIRSFLVIYFSPRTPLLIREWEADSWNAMSLMITCFLLPASMSFTLLSSAFFGNVNFWKFLLPFEFQLHILNAWNFPSSRNAPRVSFLFFRLRRETTKCSIDFFGYIQYCCWACRVFAQPAK